MFIHPVLFAIVLCLLWSVIIRSYYYLQVSRPPRCTSRGRSWKQPPLVVRAERPLVRPAASPRCREGRAPLTREVEERHRQAASSHRGVEVVGGQLGERVLVQRVEPVFEGGHRDLIVQVVFGGGGGGRRGGGGGTHTQITMNTLPPSFRHSLRFCRRTLTEFCIRDRIRAQRLFLLLFLFLFNEGQQLVGAV